MRNEDSHIRPPVWTPGVVVRKRDALHIPICTVGRVSFCAE